jgi:hypothetical protein
MTLAQTIHDRINFFKNCAFSEQNEMVNELSLWIQQHLPKSIIYPNTDETTSSLESFICFGKVKSEMVLWNWIKDLAKLCISETNPTETGVTYSGMLF